MTAPGHYHILDDDLSQFADRGPAFVTFGEVMVRDTPADNERPERTRLVHLSLAGSEFSLALGLSRLGIPSAYITRVPDNPYGWAVRNIAREGGVNVDHLVWAARLEPMGRFIYELGRTPRKSTGIYQRMYSAASRLGRGMVAWTAALRDARLFHTTGITLGLAAHSGYDLNYRSTLGSIEQARAVMTPVLADQVDVLVTSMVTMAGLYDIGCGAHTVKQIVDGDMGPPTNDDLRDFARRVFDRFDRLKIVAITLRYPDSFEQHRWESAVADADGNFYRSPAVRPVMLWDSLGGGDAWTAGFYYGLLTAGFDVQGMTKGVLVGDAISRLSQTLMYDLPMIDKAEIQSLMFEETYGGGKRTAR